jgi:hypothetical protein
MKKAVRTSDHANRTIFCFLLIEISAYSEIVFQINGAQWAVPRNSENNCRCSGCWLFYRGRPKATAVQLSPNNNGATDLRPNELSISIK